MTYADSKEALVDTSNSFVWKTDTGGMFYFLFTNWQSTIQSKFRYFNIKALEMI